MGIHRTAIRSRQRGMSFIGLIVAGVLAVSVFAIGGQSLPIFLEYQAARKAIEKAKHETTVPAVRAAFDRAAAIDDIHSVKGSDLDVTKRGEKVVVSFNYAREIPLAGPAYLVYRFQAQTD
ncbi:DUF4845 domain-containing protein [Acidovorax sp. SRB_14]|uniref:DUF4845 domain-containing protein n=1 Tax=unclassified Acidovorax TaxID=2684926 RepID=UPI00145F5CAB|nr:MULTISPECIES: DUF4845 domain-containing protein [unclassified Acidovorax]NMM77096.1 DUF4845 domain-containing protein [Acidovorax sp. SRB_24]NMM80489.1 DUF4845 domain-containing protein [Acidovorax sp. SRB_14]NMM85132.1 DUF4845 domain-containing protein [Rhodococcus sp. SRB_17]